MQSILLSNFVVNPEKYIREEILASGTGVRSGSVMASWKAATEGIDTSTSGYKKALAAIKGTVPNEWFNLWDFYIADSARTLKDVIK